MDNISCSSYYGVLDDLDARGSDATVVMFCHSDLCNLLFKIFIMMIGDPP
jgi:hypothetical protein